jgi:hypothetical protein
MESLGTGLWSRSQKEFQMESESELVKMYRLRPQSKILTRYSNPRALIATITIITTIITEFYTLFRMMLALVK